MSDHMATARGKVQEGNVCACPLLRARGTSAPNCLPCRLSLIFMPRIGSDLISSNVKFLGILLSAWPQARAFSTTKLFPTAL